MNEAEFEVHAALHDETSSGWVWCSLSNFPSRSLIEIRNRQNGSSVVCEYRQIDSFFLNTYNSGKVSEIKRLEPDGNPIVMSYWYRAALGISLIGSKERLQIAPARGYYAMIRAGLEHADHMARLATRLGLIGLWLGLDSLILGVLSLLPFFGTTPFLLATIIGILIMAGTGLGLGRILRPHR